MVRGLQRLRNHRDLLLHLVRVRVRVRVGVGVGVWVGVRTRARARVGSWCTPMLLTP